MNTLNNLKTLKKNPKDKKTKNPLKCFKMLNLDEGDKDAAQKKWLKDRGWIKKTEKVEDGDMSELARLASIPFLLSGDWFCL